MKKLPDADNYDLRLMKRQDAMKLAQYYEYLQQITKRPRLLKELKCFDQLTELLSKLK